MSDLYTYWTCNACGRGKSKKEMRDDENFMVLHNGDRIKYGDVKCDRCGSIDICVGPSRNLKDVKEVVI